MATTADGAYTATPLRCFSCQARAARAKGMNPDGLTFAITRD